MPSTLELCEKYYGTRDIYKLMDLTKDSLEKDGMKNIFCGFCTHRNKINVWLVSKLNLSFFLIALVSFEIKNSKKGVLSLVASSASRSCKWGWKSRGHRKIQGFNQN